MADPGFLPGFIGAVVAELLRSLIKAAGTAISCRQYCLSLQTVLRDLDPVVTHAINRVSTSPSAADPNLIPVDTWLRGLKETLNDAHEHVTKCNSSRLLDPWQRYRTATRIIKVTGRIRDLCVQATVVVLGVVMPLSLQSQALGNRLVEMRDELQRLSVIIATQNALDRPNKLKNDRAFYEIKTQVDKISASASTGASSSMILVDDCAEEEDLVQLRSVPQLIFGLDSLTKRLQDLVLRNDGSGETSRYVGIWGTGGAGKTLLAQIVHNSTEIQNHFGFGSIHWLTVGQNPSIQALYVTLSNRIRPDIGRFVGISIEDFKARLYNELRRKKVLLFLDDVWEERVLECLQVAAGPGSVTVVTSRNRSVLQKVTSNTEMIVSLLTEEDSWRLFCVHAFGGVENVPQELQGLARSMASECKGLPLALKVIAGAMVGKKTPEEWSAALCKLKNSCMPDNNAEKELFNRLELSYEDLEKVYPRCKQCFLYFAAFPEDFEIRKEEMFQLWVSDQEIVGDRGDDPMDDAYYSLGFLIGRSLIEITSFSNLKIHDVLRDLAIHILQRNRAEHEWDSLFRAGRNLKETPSEWMTGNEGCSSALAARRISLMHNHLTTYPPKLHAPYLRTLLLQNNSIKVLPTKLHAPYLRTLLLQNNSIKVLPGRLLRNLVNLRVLNLSGNGELQSLPNSIGRLKHLVFLDVSHTAIRKLPNSVSNLKRLEILNLSDCSQLEYLPIGVANLSSLKILQLRRCEEITRGSIWDWPRQRLPKHCLISGNQKASLEDICQLTSLQELRISRSVQPLPTALSGLKKLKFIDVAEFRRCTSLPDEMQSLVELEEMVLSTFDSLVRLPDWITSFVHLKSLAFIDCDKLSYIPALDVLPQLLELYLRKCASLKKLPTSFTRAGAFPRLRFLGVSQSGLEVFPAVQAGAMPNLSLLQLAQNLNLREWPQFVGIPMVRDD